MIYINIGGECSSVQDVPKRPPQKTSRQTVHIQEKQVSRYPNKTNCLITISANHKQTWSLILDGSTAATPIQALICCHSEPNTSQ